MNHKGAAGKTGRRKKKAGLVGNILLIGCFLLLIGLFVDNRFIRTTTWDITLPNLPASFEGTRIVHLSDLHNARFGKDNERLLAAVADARPDLVVMTGDLVSSGDTDISPSLDLMEQLSQAYETLFCMGNHEQIRDWLGRDGPDGIGALLTERGVTVLDNDSWQWQRETAQIRISGYTAALYEYADETGKATAHVAEEDPAPLFRALGMPNQDVQLLLAHNPDYLPRYAAWGASLVLSGHLHGGVVRIPGMGGLLSPSREWFPEYDAGIFREGKTQMVVSRGLGNSVIPIRVLNAPEVVVITLHRE